MEPTKNPGTGGVPALRADRDSEGIEAAAGGREGFVEEGAPAGAVGGGGTCFHRRGKA